jgi:hypothetical protein
MAMKAAVPIVIALIGWGWRIDNRVTYLEATRFTAQDAAKMASDLKDEIRRNSPPDWMRQSQGRVEAKVEQLFQITTDLRDRVVRIEAKDQLTRDR